MKLSDSQRILIIKLRASPLRLPVTLGRYDNIPYEQRVCTSCKSGHIGDEFHFIFGMSDTARTWMQIYTRIFLEISEYIQTRVLIELEEYSFDL